MKQLNLIALMVFLCLSAKAQIKDTIWLNIPMKDGHIIYEGVVKINKTKPELYKHARQWFATYFNNAKHVIQNDDSTTGQIIAKGAMYIDPGNWANKVTIQINCKDGEYRYKIYKMKVTTVGVDLGPAFVYSPPFKFEPEDAVQKLTGAHHKVSLTNDNCKRVLVSINQKTNEMIASIQKEMASQTDSFK